MRKYNKGLIDSMRRHGYKISKVQVEALEKIGANLQRKAEHACNGYHSERAEKLAETYIQKQLGLAIEIMHNITKQFIQAEFNGDPRGYGLKIRKLKSKAFPDQYVSNSAYESDVLGF